MAYYAYYFERINNKLTLHKVEADYRRFTDPH